MTATPEHHMVIHSILPDTLLIDSCHHFTPRTTIMLSFYGTNLKVLGRNFVCSPDPNYVNGSGELTIYHFSEINGIPTKWFRFYLPLGLLEEKLFLQSSSLYLHSPP